MLPRVSVVLLTYNRLDYALQTLHSTARNLKSEEQGFAWHIASDGDSDDYCSTLLMAAARYCPYVTITNSQRGGYGQNYNLAMQVAHQRSEWVIPLEDDWEMLRPLDVDPILRDMKNLGIGCARLGYLGYTQELRGKLVWGEAGHWLVFDPTSEEPHVFAGHPRIEHVSWAREVGPWPEGLRPGDTEFAVAQREASRQRVGWPLDVVKPRGDLWAHIGARRSY